jgi:hypothetical protein
MKTAASNQTFDVDGILATPTIALPATSLDRQAV